MFSKSAKYYDEIYAAVKKDYPAEVNKLRKLIQKHKQTGGVRLLDVACGTGTHASLLSQHFHVEGLDLDPKILSVARKKCPGMKFHQGDMVDFQLKSRFDVITCLFSSIGYARTKARLQRAVRNMADHLLPGGVLLVEPWFSKEQWNVGRVHLTTVNRDDAKIVRMAHASRKGNVSLLEFHYLFGTSKKIEYKSEIHQMGLFSDNDYLDTFQAAGLKVIRDAKGLDGRGLYVGAKPLAD